MSAGHDAELALPHTYTAGTSDARSTMSGRRSGDFSGSVFIISAEGKVLKLPIPTKSSQDPLNWSKWKRARAFLAIYLFAVTGGALLEGISYLLKSVKQEFPDHGPFQVEHLVAGPRLFVGIGTFIWIPLSLAIGRRPVFLICTFIIFFSAICASFATSFYQLLVSVCFIGLAEGMTGSMALLMVIDLTFIHERPQAIAMLSSIVGFTTSTITALVPRILTPDQTWRTLYYSWVFPAFGSILLAFFFYPETYFIRPPVAFNGRVLVQSATEKVHIYEKWEEAPGGKMLPEEPNTWFNDLKYWGLTRGGWGATRACYMQILGCFVNPLIFWVTLLYACVLASMLSISETYAEILSDPQYDLSPNNMALIHLMSAIGCLLAWPVTAGMIDSATRQLAIRNNGVRDAEHYLPAFIFPILIGSVTIVIYGLAAENKWHYMWIYAAFGLNNFTIISLSTAITIWVTAAFPRWAAPALVVIAGVSNMASFGMSFGIVAWIRAEGLAKANIEIGVVIALVGLVAIPISFCGKDLRQHIHERWGTSEMGALRPQ
ncbi:hypothetical protein VTL71DRAFT_3770 [Oculimacula yallundae]|uniref:Major facilitator superfamily (MFS) profile domain-containing protein n=1 Tax=Oculimacula yallundae TaxID=86028 RepID=A0ABR4C3W8_9HELO